ncbi:MAG: hypothetical protein R6V12_18415 [Candidatus Hydrogenedentota bacterium]
MFRMLSCIVSASLLGMTAAGEGSLYERARARRGDLQLGVYLTARAVEGIFEADTDAVALLRECGFTRVTIEVYRSGRIVAPDHLVRVRDYFRNHGFEVIGGIATTPGGEVGVRQEGPLDWYNWQNEKTRRDLAEIMRAVAPLFDVFVIDDFLCTGDVSEESKRAKGERAWDAYRCDLMARVAHDVFITPAKRENPDITMVVKFPQWYDRFHLFGYPVARHAAQFDRVWVGTETRGARTQRFGFVQPYEAFVNYRWIASVAPKKTECAWFDHGDCSARDFVDQAYQSVLAGARLLSIFNYSNVARGHPGDALLAQEYDHLADLAVAVRREPVWGVGAYKPVGSDAGGDLYLMDFIGMLGVPLVPTAHFPSDAGAVFLPTQAAADPGVLDKMHTYLAGNGSVILTAGFLARVPDAAKAAGVKPVTLERVTARAVALNGEEAPVKHGLDLATCLELSQAEAVLEAVSDEDVIPFLTRYRRKRGEVWVLNSHTFSQVDFDAVGEVLLAPRPLGLLELPIPAANRLRNAFCEPLGLFMDAPTRVTLQPLGERGCFIQNYNEGTVSVELKPLLNEDDAVFREYFTQKALWLSDGRLQFEIGGRERFWIERK